MADVLPANVTPEEAVEYFRRKRLAPSFDWEDVSAEEHAHSFVVAKVTQMDLLADIQAAVDDAIAEGSTLADFQKRLTPVLQEKGWWGRKRVVDPQTGEEREVQLGSPRRLETIFDTNLRTSYSAGHWERIQRTKERRPYLRYVAILDDRTRPRHRQWHGTVLPVDDPFWDAHFPPNGWRCRCSIQQLSDRDLDRYGYQVTPGAPATTTRTWQNPRTGEVRQIPMGIDPGFDNNAGRSGEERVARLFAEKLATTEAPAIAATAWERADPRTKAALGRDYDRWAAKALASMEPKGEVYVVGAMSPRTVRYLAVRGRPPITAGISIRDSELIHLGRDAKGEKRISAAMARRIPAIVDQPRAVLYDRQTSEPHLLYVFDVEENDRKGKIAVRVNFRLKGRGERGREKRITNSVRSAGEVETRNLADPNLYELVEGSL